MSTAKGINYGGRFEYVGATQEVWPDLLMTLRTTVLEPFSAGVKGRATPVPTSHAQFREDASNQEACGRLNKWAESHSIVDSWLLDAAVQTLAQWSRGNDQNRWYYFPDDFAPPEFTHTVAGSWVPELVPGWGTSWATFQKNMEQDLRDQLQKYRKRVARLWGADRKELSQQAMWTALFQRGWSPGRIRNWQPGPKHSEANILIGVREFARSIGLTLRRQKAGRRRKI